MRVLVTRPEADAATTAAALAARGHSAVLAPATRIARTGAGLPPGPFDAVIATSANAIDALDDAAVARLRAMPLHCAGERGRAIARARGFADVQPGAGDARALLASLPAGPRTYLYLAGRDRKPALEAGLTDRGDRIATVIVYEARATTELPAAAVAAIRDGGIDAVLNYSRRSADLLIALAKVASVAEELARIPQICISADAAAPFERIGAPTRIARTPDSQGLFGALESV